MPFASGPHLSYTGRGQYVTVGITDYVGRDQIIHIPSDMPTDLATIPRIFWAILPPDGAWERASVLHDYGCRQLFDGTCELSSHDVDGLFRRVCAEEGVGFLTRWALWTGVRIGALFNPKRRPGISRDLPLVIGITVAGLAVTCTSIYGLDTAVHYLIGLL